MARPRRSDGGGARRVRPPARARHRASLAPATSPTSGSPSTPAAAGCRWSSTADVFVKGAPDAVLALCRHDARRPDAVLDELTDKGLRVLAVAGRAVDGDLPLLGREPSATCDLLGLLAMQDPPRPDVAEAIQACRRAGVKVAMITGDHPATAAAIATEVGLRSADGLSCWATSCRTTTQVLGRILDRDGVVVARVSPEQKLRIARALRARGHVVAMTGDGVNDGPALHEADIGIAMGASGTDVAREAADLVLLDDHFASIVAGIEQGRATFLNIRRFLTYHLTDNVAELTPFVVWAMSGGRFPLALGVLQILALDIGTDTLSAVALGAEPTGRRRAQPPPVSRAGSSTARSSGGRSASSARPRRRRRWRPSSSRSMAAGWRPGDAFPTATPWLPPRAQRS